MADQCSNRLRGRPLMFGNSHTRKQLEEWLGQMTVDVDSVADVGGQKKPISSRVKSWKVKKYDILDLPKHDLNEDWLIENAYNIAFCLEVFEYLHNPFAAMKNLYNLLKPNGVLYASFHFIYPHHGPEYHDCLRYTRWGIDKLLKAAGFNSWDLKVRLFRAPQRLRKFYNKEKMKGLNRNKGELHQEQGYLVTAFKG